MWQLVALSGCRPGYRVPYMKNYRECVQTKQSGVDLREGFTYLISKVWWDIKQVVMTLRNKVGALEHHC